MIAGPDTSCIQPIPISSIASVKANTTSLATCDPWGLTIKDGVKPYTIVLAALSASVTTNVTLNADEDLYTYINRAGPGGQLMGKLSQTTRSTRMGDTTSVSFCG